MIRAAALAAALLSLLALAYATGRHDGKSAMQARLDAATVQAQAAASETAKALAVAEQQRRAVSQQLEDAANAQPVSSPACLPLDRVRRLAVR